VLKIPTISEIPKGIIYVTLILVVAAILPVLFIVRARTVPSAKPAVHLIPDMDAQPRFDAQEANALFADGRSMRPILAGTIARGELHSDDALYRGKVGEEWVTEFPFPVTRELMIRGRERYDILCAPCHGLAGKGDGMVARRADELQEGSWTPPSSLHDELVRGRPVGHIYNTISQGIRNMPSYGSQTSVEDRWAIVAYVRALQRSQHASTADLPDDLRSRFESN